MSLAVVRSLGRARRLGSAQEVEDFEQELVDQYLLAMVGAGLTDKHVAGERAVVFELIRFVGRPVWAVSATDLDRFLADQRGQGLAKSTVYKKAGMLAGFFDFLVARYQGDIHALTGHVVTQPVDKFNRPARTDYGALRVPPTEDEVAALFDSWRAALPRQEILARGAGLSGGPVVASRWVAY